MQVRSSVALRVLARQDGKTVHVGDTPGEVEVPDGARWWVSPAKKLTAEELAQGVTETGARELRVGGPDGPASLDDASVAPLRGLTGLRRLSLTKVGLGDAGLEALHALTGLEALELSLLKAPTDRALDLLHGWPALGRVSIEECVGMAFARPARPPAGLVGAYLYGKRAGGLVAWAAGGVGLVSLTLIAGTWARDDDVAPLGACEALRALDLGGRFKGAGLAALRQLERLGLGSCALSRKEAARGLPALERVRTLDLRAADVVDEVVAAVARMRALEELDLRGNKDLTADGLAALAGPVREGRLRHVRLDRWLQEALGRRVRFARPETPATRDHVDLLERLTDLGSGAGVDDPPPLLAPFAPLR